MELSFPSPGQTLNDAVTSFNALRESLWSLLRGSVDPTSVLEFTYPLVFILIPLPLLVALLFRYRNNRSRALLVPATLELSLGDGQGSGARFFSFWWLVALLAWCCLVFATARPLWIGPPSGAPVSGRDLMMSIDISGSMSEADLYSGNASYTRIDVVRELASDFVQERVGDRIGLIMFGSQAYVQTPLTFDHQTVAHFIREAQVGLAGRSTAIGDAIGLGVKRLRERPVESRVMILLTDGANSAGVVNPLEAAQVARDNDIRIHTIGVGSDQRAGGASIFGFPTRVQRSELDETSLIKIAETTGGQYFRARDVSELQRIYQLLDEIEPVDSAAEDLRQRRELFPWPLAMALLLALCAVCARYGRNATAGRAGKAGKASGLANA